LLATGGTAEAATKLIVKQGATVCAYSFLVELSFLEGRDRLEKHCPVVLPVVQY
jgi:adenine phosphoribosyltransferase